MYIIQSAFEFYKQVVNTSGNLLESCWELDEAVGNFMLIMNVLKNNAI